MVAIRRLLALAATLGFAHCSSAAEIFANPTLPQYGQNVSIELRGLQSAAYLPATRYVRVGQTIVVEYEYADNSFGPRRADFGQPSLDLGELVPGNYTVEARLFRMDDPGAAPQVVTRSFAVMPPENWGLYTIPREPRAFSPTDVMIKSAAYFEPGSMRVSMNGNVVRVDFDYFGSAPVGGAIPAGTTSFAAVRMPALAPGNYVIEGWGREKNTGETGKYFTRSITISSAVTVTEYYAESTDHYFMTAAPDEMALLDSGAMGGWRRTGQQFKAWLRMGDAPPDAKPVCRFYARGPNSHFYTGNAGDCQFLRGLEAKQRSEALAKGQAFLGWAYENIAFHALLPDANGQCPGDTHPVFRAYNDRAAQMDTNHRFTPDSQQRAAMAMSWIDEGVAFCSPR